MKQRKVDQLAAEIRIALIEAEITHTPEYPMFQWRDLPENRRKLWRMLAAIYILWED